MEPRWLSISSQDDPTGEQALSEVDTAKYNLEQVLKSARKVESVYSKFSGSDFQMESLKQLISDFSVAFSFIRRKLKSQHPALQAGAGETAKLTAPDKYPTIDWNAYSCLCPLATLLGLVANSLTNLRVRINDQTSEWGPLAPLRNVLSSLSKSLKFVEQEHGGRKYKFYPGISQCFMFHEVGARFTVTSSSVRYNCLDGLAIICREVRLKYIHELKSKCPPELLKTIAETEKNSTDLYNNSSNAYNKDKSQQDLQNPFDNPAAKATVPGTGATFDPEGNYRLACMIDFYRFIMEKPKKALKKENKASMKRPRPAFPAESCAEWELWIIALSTLKPLGYPEPVWPTSRRIGMPKSNTLQSVTTPASVSLSPPRKSRTISDSKTPPASGLPAGNKPMPLGITIVDNVQPINIKPHGRQTVLVDDTRMELTASPLEELSIKDMLSPQRVIRPSTLQSTSTPTAPPKPRTPSTNAVTPNTNVTPGMRSSDIGARLRSQRLRPKMSSRSSLGQQSPDSRSQNNQAAPRTQPPSLQPRKNLRKKDEADVTK